MKILISWIGQNDFDGIGNTNTYAGNIVTALKAEKYDHLFLFNNYKDKDSLGFKSFIQNLTSAEIIIQKVDLSSPTNHKEIYTNVRDFVKNIALEYPHAELTFQTSSGTSAMALTWMLLSPVYNAKLIECSKEAGVQAVALPFEIVSYFLPDKELIRLTEHKAPVDTAFKDIIHASPIMVETISKAQHVAPRDITVLIEGESGTGKELFARAIHESSNRKDKPFIAVNCGAISSELIESSLFGYEKGAFTGANQRKDGHFKEADGGTLFLDELGEISQKTQVALLRVLQENEIVRIGSSKAEKVDVRIIAATNRNLLDEVAKGNFRADLFYRLAIACLYLPPLRERGNDIYLLLEDALQKANTALAIEDLEKHKKFSDSAKKVMFSHPWKGNIRELYNTVMRAVLWSKETIISAESIKQSLFQSPNEQNDILNRSIGNGFSLNDLIADVARTYIKKAEEESHGNKRKASELLGFENYQTYTNWQKKYMERE